LPHTSPSVRVLFSSSVASDHPVRSTLSLHDALPISILACGVRARLLDRRTRGHAGGRGPEHAAFEADALVPAMLIVLETLRPQERVAFVLHDVSGASCGAPAGGRWA